MPPAGGFEAIKYRRNLPLRGPGAYVILGGVTAISAYGFYKWALGAYEKRQVSVWPFDIMHPRKRGWVNM